MNITIVIIAITAIVSYLALKNRTLFYKLSLNPYSIFRKNEWYRLITHGFIHGDITHLLVNMLVFFSFGMAIEPMINSIGNMGNFSFILFYFGALVFSSLYDLFTKKDNYLYNSIGASGAVSAIVFASILFAPWNKIYFMAIVPIPSVLFGVLYLWYEQYQNKKGGGNINHQAHIWGAVWGLLFPILLEPKMFLHFINQLMSPKF